MAGPRSPELAEREVAERMAVAASGWLGSLDEQQRGVAMWRWPSTDSEAERLRWYYTPTDHGGLTIAAMGPTQQRRAMQLVATGLSTAGYVTVATIMGLENVLDHTEGWQADWGRERGRDPGLYYLRVFGEPGGDAPWAWRFGGHHVSLNNLVVGGEVRATTPCFLGADPASSPLLGPHPLRPLAGAEDLARDLVRSLDEAQRERALISGRAPVDIVGGNRPLISDGDRLLPLPEIWRGRFTEPQLAERVAWIHRTAEDGAGFTAADHDAVQLTAAPKGLPAGELDAAQRDRLRALLAVYTGRVPDELARREGAKYAGDRLDAVHLAWAGSTEPGRPHYYRLQGPGLLVEFDNVQRKVNHAHAVWRDPGGDFGADVLAAHHVLHHGP